MCYYRGAGRSHAYHGADVFRTAWMLKMSRCQRQEAFAQTRPLLLFAALLHRGPMRVTFFDDSYNTPLVRSAIAGPAPISRLLETVVHVNIAMK